MAKTHPKFRNGQFDGLESSPEILEAIEDLARFEFDLDDEENCPAYRIWADPTDAEMAEVIATAWACYAEDDQDKLHWGETPIRRNLIPTPPQNT